MLVIAASFTIGGILFALMLWGINAAIARYALNVIDEAEKELKERSKDGHE